MKLNYEESFNSTYISIKQTITTNSHLRMEEIKTCRKREEEETLAQREKNKYWIQLEEVKSLCWYIEMVGKDEFEGKGQWRE